MSENSENTNTHNQGSGQSVSVRLVGFDQPFFTALAAVLGIGGMIMGLVSITASERVDAKAVYWLQRDEAFLETLSAQGYSVPKDLLNRKGDLK